MNGREWRNNAPSIMEAGCVDGHVGAWVEGRFDGLEEGIPGFRCVAEHGGTYCDTFDFKFAQVEFDSQIGEAAGRARNGAHGGAHLVQHGWRYAVDWGGIHAAGGKAL